jgi:glutamate racemase
MIGVFDSGFGGLTVHRAPIEALPERDFVYLGDNRNAPYGARPPIDVLNLTCAALERLFAEGCTLAVVAEGLGTVQRVLCGTATRPRGAGRTTEGFPR